MGPPPGTDSSSAGWQAALPAASPRRIALRVTGHAERAIRAGHPWLFQQSITSQSHQGQPGDLAILFDRKGRFLAVGLYDPHSPLRVRVLQALEPTPIDQAWYQAQLAEGLQLRASLPRTQTTGYRLVHGENDGLPGLVIDRYGDTLVVKLYTAAWVAQLPPLHGALEQVTSFQRSVLRLSRAVQRQVHALHGLADGQVLSGPPLEGPVLFQENGLVLEADVRLGQKTGFYLDQRDNRARVERLAAGQRVLNVFAYTGGFSLYAARGRATHVVSVDRNERALEVARRNFALNQDNKAVAVCQHQLLCADAFEALRGLAEASQRFDVVVLDPPSFAARRSQRERALASYERLTEMGLAVLRRGGLLVQASCTRHVEADSFFAAVHHAAGRIGRTLTEIERTGHGLDHPVAFSQGAYLKCLFALA